jgi:hypothetical protein
MRDTTAWCELGLPFLAVYWIARECTVDQAPYTKKIFIFQFIRRCSLAKIIVALFKL